jgi:hypothetical protein
LCSFAYHSFSQPSLKVRFALPCAFVILFHSSCANAANRKHFRKVGVPHHMDVSDLRTVTHLTGQIGFAKVVNVNASPAFVRDTSLAPFAAHLHRPFLSLPSD